MRNFSRL